MQGAQSVNGYVTVRLAAEAAFTEKKSRFIGRIYPVSGEAEAEEIIKSLRKQYWEAAHHCYAFRLGVRGEIARSSDDGEPSSTAGMPILNVLTSADITNALIVVTRYFGGVLLGAGGLVRAYSKAASMALSAAEKLLMLPCKSLTMTVPYPLWGMAERLLREKAVLENVVYGEAVTVEARCPARDADALIKLMTERSDGRLSPEMTDGGLHPFLPPRTDGLQQEEKTDEA